MTHRVTIYWKIGTNRVHAIQVCDRLPITLSLNGEQYLDVTDEQLARLQDYERQGLLEFRHKELAIINGVLQPAATMSLSNNYNTKRIAEL